MSDGTTLAMFGSKYEQMPSEESRKHWRFFSGGLVVWSLCFQICITEKYSTPEGWWALEEFHLLHLKDPHEKPNTGRSKEVTLEAVGSVPVVDNCCTAQCSARGQTTNNTFHLRGTKTLRGQILLAKLLICFLSFGVQTTNKDIPPGPTTIFYFVGFFFKNFGQFRLICFNLGVLKISFNICWSWKGYPSKE